MHWAAFVFGAFFGLVIGALLTAGRAARAPGPDRGPLREHRADAYPAPYRSGESPYPFWRQESEGRSQKTGA